MVQQRSEPRVLIPSCHFTHAVQPAWHAWPGPVSGACRPVRVPLGQSLPSAASAAAALFGGIAGTTGLSDFPWPFVSGLRPQPSLSGPPGDHPHGQPWDLPVLAPGGSAHAQVLRPRGVRRQLALTLTAMLPSAQRHGVGTRTSTFRGSIAPPAYPCQRFACALADTCA